MNFPRLPESPRSEALALAREGYHRLAGVIRRTPGLLALSFLLGVTIWVFVTDTENPTVVDVLPSPIPVEAVNVGQSLAVANQLSPVEVRVTAAADRWKRLTAANFHAFVDVNGVEGRAQEAPVRVEVVGVGGVRVVDTNPRTVTVNLEPVLTNTVPVTAQTVGQLPFGYALQAVVPAAQTVTVRGPASLVALVSQAVAEVNITGLTAGVESGVTLRPQGAGGGEIRGVRIDPAAVKVSVQVLQSTIVRSVPLTMEVIGVPDIGYRVSAVSTSPVTVQVQGAIEVLQHLDRIVLPPVNVTGSRSDIARTIDIPLPNGVALLGPQRATETVNIVAISGSQRTALAIEPANVPSGLVAQLPQSSAVVVVDGPLPTLNSLLPGDIRATVDAGGRGPGVYTLPVTVVAPHGVAVQSVQPESVAVTIAPP